MSRLTNTLDRAPMYWVAVGLGLLVFALNRLMPGLDWSTAPTEQSLLDGAFVEAIRVGGGHYSLMPDVPQTLGAHVLPRYLRAAVAGVTGDADRAGIWLSLAGVTATICGLYTLAMRILPMRGYGLITVAAAGGLGAVNFAVSPDPSAAIGMALVVWGMAFFLTSLTRHNPHEVFASALLFGLAGYVRIELSLIWIFLAVYLVVLHLASGGKRRQETPALSMAVGGILMVLLVLWPMMHRNFTLAATPVLPGVDADLILGAPAAPGSPPSVSFLSRLGQGMGLLLTGARGPGIFPGLLWPLGMGICLLIGRHKQLPYFWIPVVLSTLLAMTGLSLVTGLTSYRETLQILTPMLFPFAALPFAFVIQRWVELESPSLALGRTCWWIAGAVLLALVQVPHFLRPVGGGSRGAEDAREELVSSLEALPARQRRQLMVSDQPGAIVRAGKFNVIGTRGQTDFEILTAAYADGSFRTDALTAFLRERGVGLLHLSDPGNPLVDQLRLESGAPRLRELDGISPPHRVFRLSWP